MHPELRSFVGRYLSIVGFCLMGVASYTFLNLPYATLEAGHQVHQELTHLSTTAALQA